MAIGKTHCVNSFIADEAAYSSLDIVMSLFIGVMIVSLVAPSFRDHITTVTTAFSCSLSGYVDWTNPCGGSAVSAPQVK